MGIIRANSPITDLEIPASIARDTEYISADAAHANATDPHLQYPTQARGDIRYVRYLNSFEETINGPITLAANTWQELGSARVVGEQSKLAIWIIGIYFQYVENGAAQPYFQYGGAGTLGTIFWQADLLTNEGTEIPFEAHNEADFKARIRFGRGQSRKLEISPSRAINIAAPGFATISGVRVKNS